MDKQPDSELDSAKIRLQRRVKIRLRDGLYCAASVYTPKEQTRPAPCIVALTPYTADHLHDRGVYFAARGFPFVAVDVCGRGDSDGNFKPWARDASDGCNVIEWVASQPYCSGKVGMYGASYLGYVQWATASKFPPHLTTIVPTAAPYPGVDVPMRSNVFALDQLRWQTFVSGRAPQMKAFADQSYWTELFRRRHEAGRPVREADVAFDDPSAVFQEYLDHPTRDAYWDSYSPTASDYARLRLPILTITGVYDGDQPGALEHYAQHMRAVDPAESMRHYLVIGPWNHVGCTRPSAEFDGLSLEPSSVIDILGLHLEWYAWTLLDGPKPSFLQNNVAYYVAGAGRWRYAPTLQGVTGCLQPLYLESSSNATDVLKSGGLTPSRPAADRVEPDFYIYDPRDLSGATLESALNLERWIVDQSWVHGRSGKHVVYHSSSFEKDTEISGFFRFVAWISIDQPDTDFRVRVYEIDAGGNSILLTFDSMRARYRESSSQATLVRTQDALRYEFDRFFFTSRLVKKGSRLRLVLGPIDSMYEEKNYNSGGVVADESMEDARPVTVRLFHDALRPSALYVPIGQGESA